MSGLDSGYVFSPSSTAAADLAFDAVVMASAASVPAAAAVLGDACSQKGLLQPAMKTLESDRILKIELFRHTRQRPKTAEEVTKLVEKLRFVGDVFLDFGVHGDMHVQTVIYSKPIAQGMTLFMMGI
ncbi:hypothetical protein OIU78_022188 [Salix suchowensis]|nr:hypothetical protein OIU78_022188 [Salix suchowensis]